MIENAMRPEGSEIIKPLVDAFDFQVVLFNDVSGSSHIVVELKRLIIDSLHVQIVLAQLVYASRGTGGTFCHACISGPMR